MKRWPILLLALVTAASAGSQDAASWGLGGTLSTQPRAAYAGSGAFDIAKLSYGSATTLGLDLKATGERARAEASVEAAILTGASARLAWAVALSPFGRPDELLLPAPPAPEAGSNQKVSFFMSFQNGNSALIPVKPRPSSAITMPPPRENGCLPAVSEIFLLVSP